MKVLAFEKVKVPAPVDVNVFSAAPSGTTELTVKGLEPAWEMPVIPVPMMPESIASCVLPPTFEIVPVSFWAPETVIVEPVLLGLNWIFPTPETAPCRFSANAEPLVLFNFKVGVLAPAANVTVAEEFRVPEVVRLAVPAALAIVMVLGRVKVAPLLVKFSVAPGVIVIAPVPNGLTVLMLVVVTVSVPA